MDYQHWKAKTDWFGRKYFTRKSSNIMKWNMFYPRANWEFFWQTNDRRSKRRKFYQKLTNKISRKKYFGCGWEYKKIYDLKRSLD